MNNFQTRPRTRKHGMLNRLGILMSVLVLGLILAACGSTPIGASLTTSGSTASTTAVSTTNAASESAATSSKTANATPEAAATTPAKSNISQPVQQATPASSAQTPDQVESNTVVGVVKQVSPAVVTVYNKTNSTQSSRSGRSPFGNNGNNNPNPTNPNQNNSNPDQGNSLRTQAIGSGVIISNQGYIVTNAHVVEGQKGVTVAFDNGKQVVTATVVGTDTTGDIAVLKIEGPVPAVAKWGDSSKVQVGETAIAIGSALGDFRNSVTKGVVSGLNRTLDASPTVYLQTDAPINHGNSGGPLLNLNGEIIGINTAVLRNTPSSIGVGGDVAESLGFAIPSNTAKMLADQLISKGSVTRPYFGISYQMITPALAGSVINGLNIPQVEGAWIQGSTRSPGIVAGGPADKAGLKDNDVITAINGVALNDNNPLVNAVLSFKPGDTIKLTVQRGNQTLTINLTLGERPSTLG